MRLLYLFIIFFGAKTAFAQHADLILRNGRIVDGSGNPWYRGDVAIRHGRIVGVGQIKHSAKREIDVQGLIIAPGFIDVHTHIEGSLPKIPTADNFLQDGVTTLITGNCGNSAVRLNSFFKELEKTRISANVGSLIGHNDVREAVMGKAMRAPTPEEQQQMEQLVTQAMADGCLGLSTGLIYIPGTYAKTDEVVGLAKAAAAGGGVYVSHIRDEAHHVKEAIDEAINIGRAAQMPVQISHFKLSAKPMWGKSTETLNQVKAARAEGLDVTIDQYPYTASSTNLGTLIPSWVLADTDSVVYKRLTDSTLRLKIRNEMLRQLATDNRLNYDYAVIARYAPDSTLQGKSIHQINQEKGRPSTPEAEAELIMDLHAGGFAQMVFHKMNETDVRQIMQYPFTMIASDAGVSEFNRNMPHPRGYGSNARVLGRYVREQQLLTLEDAIRRMTSLPATRFGLKDRGLLREGYAADLVVFDPQKVQDEATFEKPHAYSSGFAYVLVNGKLTIDHGQHTGERAGVILRKK